MTADRRAPPAASVFTREVAERYDETNRRLAPISEAMHFLLRLVLEDLPPTARVLCVGVGTGADILALGTANPGWSFIGVDPSAGMLEVCRARLGSAGMLDRCRLIHGQVDDAPEGAAFDAAVSLLVAHFVERGDRSAFYRGIHDRLRPGGTFVSTEISADLASAAFPAMLRTWARVQALMGATPDALLKLPDTLRETLCVLTPAETEALWRQCGFADPVPFFQASLIRGWHAVT